ncbi:MAG: multicopper oxidase domain-containing protein [Saprospiraceae bacterium]
MIKNISFLLLIFCFFDISLSAQYNPLHIPDTLSGTQFNLTLIDTFTQLRSGNQTITSGVNKNVFWGPTLIFNQGDTVHMNVRNNLNDSTTIHWHGFHLPAVMDGGPHQIIPPGTIWQPYWKVTNQASTYWYHPHLHQMTQEQMTKGLGGFIIVRDAEEAKLALPRTYGIDDIPLALTSRRYDASNQFVFVNSAYGDYMLTNGTPNAEVSLPKQFVRLRILNAEMERAYNLGFSDNRTFYIIGNDGGLLNAPVPVTRMILAVGERVEIMVDLGNDAVGSVLDLNAYNSGFALGFPGGEPATSGQFGSLLNNTTFSVLHVIIASPTANGITALPQTLANNTYPTAADATVNRTLNVTGGQGPVPFSFDNTPFVFSKINKTIDINTTEKWTITNNNIFGHAFHIHDVQFKIVSRSSGAVAPYESGWKDVLYLPRSESATFVARFTDYSDDIHPFMYHCHFANHEDGGMMGQFVVTGETTSTKEVAPLPIELTLYPNPTDDRIYISLNDPSVEVYYIRLTNASGRTIYMLPRPHWQAGIDVSHLPSGIYMLQLTDEKTKAVTTKSFVKK